MSLACEDPAAISVCKTIACDPFDKSNDLGGETILQTGDSVTFAVEVRNGGGVDATVDIEDLVPTGLTAVTWTKTDPADVVTTGAGDISETGVLLPAGGRIRYLIEATFSPDTCQPFVINVVKVTLGAGGCCGEDAIFDYAKIVNGDPGAAKAKLDPTVGFNAMEVLTYLIESLSFEQKVTVAEFVNGCGTLAEVISGSGGGGGGDGLAVAILDTFGNPTGLYGETSPGF